MGTSDFKNARYTLEDLPEDRSAESANFSPPKEKRDLFSLGIVLCELLNGVNPFWNGNPADTSSSILNDSPKYASSIKFNI